MDWMGVAGMLGAGLAFGLIATVAYWAHITIRNWPSFRRAHDVSVMSYARMAVTELFSAKGFATFFLLAASLGMLVAAVINLIVLR